MQYTRIDYGHIFRVFKRLFGYLDGRGGRFWIGSLLSLLQMLTSFLVPYLYQSLIDGAGSGAGAGELIGPLVLPFLALIAIAPLVCLGTYWQRSAANNASANMQKDVAAHVVSMPVSAHDVDRADKLLRATQNTQQAAGMLGSYILQKVFKFAAFTGGALALLLGASPRFALIGVVGCAIMFALSTFLNSRLRALEAAALSTDASAASYLMQMLTNLPIVKLYQLESRLGEQYHRAGMDAFHKRLTYMQLRGVLDGGMDFLYFAIQPLAVVIGVNAAASGAMSFAELVYIAGLLSVMLSGMRELGFFIQLMQKGIVNAERAFSLLDEPAEPDPVTTAHPDLSADFAVALRDVHFGYAPDKPTLRGIDLRIPRGAHVAIVGPSGCGKSTLLKLILRFYEIGAGEIDLFGASMDGLDNESLRALSAYIPQDSGLFDGTILENILLGSEGKTPEQAMQAMKDAALYETVMAMPQREHTPIGEGGALLSGGQGQRIAIARALLKDAPLILLDEATSALDVDTEAEIHRSLSRVATGKTILCVTHRLSTIADFDLILFMEDGQIVESGTHGALMRREGAYYRMYTGAAE